MTPCNPNNVNTHNFVAFIAVLRPSWYQDTKKMSRTYNNNKKYNNLNSENHNNNKRPDYSMGQVKSPVANKRIANNTRCTTKHNIQSNQLPQQDNHMGQDHNAIATHANNWTTNLQRIGAKNERHATFVWHPAKARTPNKTPATSPTQLHCQRCVHP